jgi:hypothetical protein
MTAPLPDLIAAMITRARALPNTSALIGARASARLRIKDPKTDVNGWPMPTYGIVFRKVPGPVAERPGNVPVKQQPVQYECYGPDLRTADVLARTFIAELFPDPPDAQSFKAANCAVMSIQEMGAGAPLMESETDFPRVVGTLLIQYCERPQ